MKKIVGALMVGVMLLTGCQGKTKNTATLNDEIPNVTGTVTLSVLDIGKADCIFIETSKHNIMIDTGKKKDADEILEFLSEKNIDTIDYLQLTHYDKDHIGGLRKLLDAGISFGTIYAYNKPVDSKDYNKMMAALEEHNKQLTYLSEPEQLVVDDFVMDMYPPMWEEYGKKSAGEENENEYSIVTKCIHGQQSFLLTGDACNDRIQEVMQQTDVRDCNFIKIPHHGKYDKDLEKMLKSCHAQYAAITCSDKHPADEKIEKILNQQGIATYETKNGCIEVVSDGDQLQVKQEKVKEE